MTNLLQKCADAGLKMTDQRKAILKVLEDSDDHPSVEAVTERARKIDDSISIATVYRTLGMLAELGFVLKHDFKGDYARFEVNHHHEGGCHHHLVDTETGQVIEFENDELEKLVSRIADELGYDMVDHTFEIFGHKKKK